MRKVFLILSALFIVGCGLQPPASVLSLTPHSSSKTVYIVKPKDTLHSVARDTGVNYTALVRLNKIQPPFTIYVGQRLLLRDDNSIPKTQTMAVAPSKQVSIKSQYTQNVIQPQKKQQATNKAALNTVPNDTVKQINAIQTVVQKNKLQWVWPAKGPILGKFAVGSTKKKNGVDIGGSSGLLIKAAAPGRVVYSGSGLRGYGNLIIIKHNNNFLSAYAHNRKNIVAEGAEVKVGQSIAEMGNTGTNKVMLHFEIRYNGSPIDPEKLLPRK